MAARRAAASVSGNGKENLSVAVAFDLSYADLDPDLQRLFRQLGLHSGPEVDPYAAAALDGSGLRAEAWRCCTTSIC